MTPTIFLSLLIAGQSGGPSPVVLKRIFTPGMVSKYSVDANLHQESRSLLDRDTALDTFLPSDTELSYGFSTNTLSSESGVGKLRYSKPSVQITEGETTESGPKTNVEKLNQIVLLSVSSINEILDEKDISPKKPKQKASESEFLTSPTKTRFAQGISDIIGPFISDVERLSLFVGGIDSSMDFAPKLDSRAVKPGDTWKRTVGFQPQKLKAKSDKVVVQRLDISYSYNGIVTNRGKQVYRVHAVLDLHTDLGTYLNELLEAGSEETHVKSIPLNLNAQIDFDLDLKTCQTLYAVCNSTADFKFFITDREGPVQEEKTKGNNILTLVSNTMASHK